MATGLDWYIVHIASGNDARARRYCELYRVPFYYPMVGQMRRAARRKVTLKKRADRPFERHLTPLFPGYCFVELDGPFAARSVFAMAGIEGVTAASDRDTPGRLPYRHGVRELVEALKAREEGDPPAIPGETPAELVFSVGDRVSIVGGAFNAHQARIVAMPMPSLAIEEIDSDTRLSVAIAAFGRVLDVELAVGQLAKLTS
jgi:transcription antitermination factor NusG